MKEKLIARTEIKSKHFFSKYSRKSFTYSRWSRCDKTTRRTGFNFITEDTLKSWLVSVEYAKTVQLFRVEIVDEIKNDLADRFTRENSKRIFGADE
jgi:hypothetical protein